MILWFAMLLKKKIFVFDLGSKGPEEDRDSSDGSNRLGFYFFRSEMYFQGGWCRRFEIPYIAEFDNKCPYCKLYLLFRQTTLDNPWNPTSHQPRFDNKMGVYRQLRRCLIIVSYLSDSFLGYCHWIQCGRVGCNLLEMNAILPQKTVGQSVSEVTFHQ